MLEKQQMVQASAPARSVVRAPFLLEDPLPNVKSAPNHQGPMRLPRFAVSDKLALLLPGSDVVAQQAFHGTGSACSLGL